MLRKNIFLLSVFMALYPAAGLCQTKDQDRKLVVVDSSSFRMKVDELMGADPYNLLDVKDQILIRGFVERIRVYLDGQAYDRSDREIQACFDSLAVLWNRLETSEEANAGLRKEVEGLERQKAVLDSLHAKDNEMLAAMDAEMESMKQSYEESRRRGDRALSVIYGRTDAIGADMQTVRETSLRQLDPSFFQRIQSSLDAISPILSELDPERLRVLKKGMEDMAVIESFRKVVSGSDALFSGIYSKPVRISLLEELKALDRKRGVLSPSQKEEISLYRKGLENEGMYVYDFMEFSQSLLKQGCLSRPETIRQWQDKLTDFLTEHETYPEWALMPSLHHAVEALSAFLQPDRDAAGRIPCSDPDVFEKRIREIWAAVEQIEL